ncbi:hypothetical protein IJZ97_06705 [bacterium]|nr:hypothetical protein [bacterium]
MRVNNIQSYQNFNGIYKLRDTNKDFAHKSENNDLLVDLYKNLNSNSKIAGLRTNKEDLYIFTGVDYFDCAEDLPLFEAKIYDGFPNYGIPRYVDRAATAVKSAKELVVKLFTE